MEFAKQLDVWCKKMQALLDDDKVDIEAEIEKLAEVAYLGFQK